MSFPTTLLIAVGLAMDALTVSICGGLVLKEARLKHALRMGLFFGGFQAGMPVLGWLAGRGLAGFIEAADHWIAFGLLAAIGGKMIHDALGKTHATMDPSRIGVLLMLSIATSIDALAVGVTFALLGGPILAPALTIGAVTFLLSVAGVLSGHRLGHGFESKVGVAGGLILIGIGVKILVEHTCF